MRSVTRASEELSVTQAAVSRQVVALEEYLGLDLLTHRRGRVELTPAGLRYYKEIQPAVSQIRDATDRVASGNAESVVRILTYPTLAQHWLVPRLPTFLAAFPSLDVQVITRVRPAHMIEDDFDVAILYGAGVWEGLRSFKLIEDEISPVCSPEFAERFDLVGNPARVAAAARIDANYRRTDWTDWLRGMPERELAPSRRLRVTSSELAYQAARTGLGVAMGQTRLLGRDFELGHLMRPIERVVVREDAYHLAYRCGAQLSGPVLECLAWLRAVAQPARDSAGPTQRDASPA
ncbi:LysR family transcriptional regulator [Enterovirga sp. DB1703]|uniref:LysR family transcriptional regulator n=1 Tax=Enterovirga aerilata TaxID=2730920 RepID=A0A849IDV0_9HYPH|nr:LysR family transcriptional regulator [Enterovirga sp. DB1703]